MNHILEQISDQVRDYFEEQTTKREYALAQARLIIRHSAQSIRATHRGEKEKANEELTQAKVLTSTLMERLQQYPQIFYAGYTQDAIKEYVEAAITYSIIFQLPLPTPQELNVNYEPYLLGLAEANGELRRHCLDILRSGYSEKAEIILSIMDDIYSLLITLDYPEAVTGGLRRVTDLVRSINERTRGEITIILRESQLEEKLTLLSNKLQYGHSEA